MSEEMTGFSYQQAREAYEGNQKLHVGSRVYLVRPALRVKEEGLVLWVTDQRTRGDHGWLLFPDGRVEAK
jgi:hypothetical protein